MGQPASADAVERVGQKVVVELADSRGDDAGAHVGVAPVRLFTLADARHFAGLVALVNSLRLHGNREPVTVLDLGLAPAQREVLGAECDFVEPPASPARHPWLLEPWACMAQDAEVVVYVDADVILTDSLDAVYRTAREGNVVVFTDVIATRHFGEWAEVFGLEAPLRRQPYVNAGFLAFSSAHHPRLLTRWAECCDRMVGLPTYLDADSFAAPTALSSQDALNAILMSEVPKARVDIRPAAEVAQGQLELTHTRIDDAPTLRCTRDGRAVSLLHAWGSPKPWEPDARSTLRRSAYLTCLRRLLVGDDVVVRTPPGLLPTWLHPGARGRWVLWYLTQARRPWRGARERARGLAERRRRGLPDDA